MATFRPFRRAGFALLFGLLGSFQALRAQWDPRLQKSPTDFMDLYQQSTAQVIEPEILCLFDFSGSLRSLMYHPLFFSGDTQDADTYTAMSFTLKGNGSSSQPYVVLATLPQGSLWDGGTSPSVYMPAFSGGKFPPTGGGTAMAYSKNTQGNYAVVITLKSGNTLMSDQLIKPNGSVVSQTDAAAATSSSLAGASYGAADVRNWIRAASHVRFQYEDASNGNAIRTVDLPLPWKNLNAGSSGNPLGSQTLNDPVSGQNIEFDLNYKGNNGDAIFATSMSAPYDGCGEVAAASGSSCAVPTSSAQTTCYLQNVAYRSTSMAWCFTARYPGTGGYPYGGQYVVFDAGNAGLAGGQGSLAWGQGFGVAPGAATMSVPMYTPAGVYTGSNGTQDASLNVLPTETRNQAVKRAAITTWINYQGQVVMAYRFLDCNNEVTATVTDSSSSFTVGNPTTGVVGGEASGWQVFNGNSVAAMQNIASYWAYNGTPLTYAMARAHAQFLDPSSVFNSVENGTAAPLPLQCLTHFLILFTDGVDNNDTSTTNPNSGTPYLNSNGGVTGGPLVAGTAASGNAAILANANDSNLAAPSGGNNGGSWWNLFTFAGIGAHLADSTQGAGNYLAPPSSYPASGTAKSYLPYAILSRNGVAFSPAHRVQTMTVGVSLGGQYTNTSSPKYALFAAAAIGDPNTSSWNLGNCTAFTLANPSNPADGPASGSIYFFDGSNPNALVSSLNSAFRAAVAISNVNSTSNPNLPFMGGSLANEAYLGTFQPPATGGVLWSGDLLMFPTRMVNGTPALVDPNGNAITSPSAGNAGWAASNALNPASGGRLWSGRNLYTRLPNGNALVPFTDLNSATNGNAFTALAPYLCTDNTGATSASKAVTVQWAAGGNTAGTLDASNRPTTNRVNLMGDIIDSAPAPLEYTWSSFITSRLTSALAAQVSASATNHFRLIVAGDNQGWVHGFGEVSNASTLLNANGSPVTDANGNPVTLVKAAVDELWAFMPTDFLGYLDQLQIEGNKHRFMADGSPMFYFLDLPSTGSPVGNGTVDQGTGERAVVVFGLGKGGRSYYALNVLNPFAPTLAWAIRPDESTTAPVMNMGFSTGMPSWGRIVNSGTGVPEDVVFLGGGTSNPATENQFLNGSGNPTKLGRSVLAVDASTGATVASVDLSGYTAASGTTPGPIAAGVVPFEFVLGSGMAQRAYFMDFYGGLWCWDQDQTNLPASVGTLPSQYTGFRVDTPYLDRWTGVGSGASRIRQVYQDTDTVHGAYYSSLPSPFLVGSFPGGANLTGEAAPSAVGITLASGDRNNPLDNAAGYTNGTPTCFRLTQVFDRQDAALWAGKSGGTQVLNSDGVIRDANLQNLGNTPGNGLPQYTAGNGLVTPGNAAFYLAPVNANGSPNTAQTRFGYWMNFPPASGGFIPKALTAPSVVANTLFYSYFTPTSVDSCAGGSGNTYTDLVCSDLSPALSTSGASCVTGNGLPFTSWNGVASTLALYGNQGVIQAGVETTTNPTTGATSSQVALETVQGNAGAKATKARVWRTVN